MLDAQQLDAQHADDGRTRCAAILADVLRNSLARCSVFVATLTLAGCASAPLAADAGQDAAAPTDARVTDASLDEGTVDADGGAHVDLGVVPPADAGSACPPRPLQGLFVWNDDLVETRDEILALAEARGEDVEADLRLLQAVNRLHEQNPMLGLRGVRLGLVLPGLFALQVRAIAEAACFRQRMGGDPRAEIMIPLVGSIQELELVIDEAAGVLKEVADANGCTLRFPIGTMIELPRAALTAGQIAEAAEFFSFGTNDLTQTTWGFSRDDVEAAFFSAYLEKGVFGVSPFESIDREGVGELVRIAVKKGRAKRHNLHCGVCGEHGGDPDSIHFFDEVGLDYVSCSPFRVPVARLEAGRAALARHVGRSDTR